jgi:hypothetical protein
MRLLELAHNRSAPAADDFTPVLVYVLIKVVLQKSDISIGAKPFACRRILQAF